MDISAFLNSFRPHNTAIPFTEKLRSGLVSAIAILLLGLSLKFLPLHAYPIWMFASMGASATLLFAAPHSPMAQPWNLIGGHLVSATAGLLCAYFIADPVLAAGIGAGSAIFLMLFLNCLHPPGAATALIIILNSDKFLGIGWKMGILLVVINAFISLLLALALNNLLPGRKYPMQQMPQTPPKPSTLVALEQRDLEWALEQMDAVIDISEDDLSRIYELALRHAQERYDSAIKNK